MKTQAGPAGRIAGFFIDSKLTPLVIIASILLGIAAVVALPREEEPQIIVPMIDVFVQIADHLLRGIQRSQPTPLVLTHQLLCRIDRRLEFLQLSITSLVARLLPLKRYRLEGVLPADHFELPQFNLVPIPISLQHHLGVVHQCQHRLLFLRLLAGNRLGADLTDLGDPVADVLDPLEDILLVDTEITRGEPIAPEQETINDQPGDQ